MHICQLCFSAQHMYVGGTHVSYTLCIDIGEGLTVNVMHQLCEHAQLCFSAQFLWHSKNELVGRCRTAFNSVVSLLVLFYVVTAGEHQP